MARPRHRAYRHCRVGMWPCLTRIYNIGNANDGKLKLILRSLLVIQQIITLKDVFHNQVEVYFYNVILLNRTGLQSSLRLDVFSSN